MNCFYCKGAIEQVLAAFMVELDNCIIVIKNVPTDTCLKCGQKSYSDKVADRIEKITTGMRNTMTEIAIMHYTENIVA